MPAGTIEQDDGMGSPCYTTCNLVDMQLHAGRPGKGQHQTCRLAECGADGAEQPGIFIALIGRLAWSGATPCPLPDKTVLLPDAGLVLPPELDPSSPGQMSCVSAQDRGEVFLNASMTDGSCPG